jgi:TadE-like protein
MNMSVSKIMRTKRLSKRLKSDVSGVAMVEFALALPFLLAVTLGGLEFTNIALSNMRISQIAMMVADNAGRVRTSIDRLDVNEVMIGARFAGDDLKLGTFGRVILSSLENNGQAGANAGNVIRWQRCFGAKNDVSSYGVTGDGATDSSLAAGMGQTGQRIIPVPGTALMFTEVLYDYQYLIPSIYTESLFPKRTLRYTAAFTVRERATNTLFNASNLPDGATASRDCGTFSAT